MKAIKSLIKLTIEDLVHKFLWDDRKEDEELERGEIEKAIEDGTVTVEWMVKTFETALRERLEGE